MSEEQDINRAVRELAESFRALREEALRQYTPVVEAILRTQSRDIRRIEGALDGLLDFCGDGAALRLFKTLCRYYHTLDPAATADYVRFYREQYDPDETEALP